MNKHTAITIIAILVIVIPFGYSGLNILAAEQIQFKWNDDKPFSYFEMSNNGEIQICNSFPITTNINQFQIATYYEGASKGTFTIPSSNIESGSNILHGSYAAEEFPAAQFTLMQIDAQFNGAAPVRLDPTQIAVVVSIDTPILGLIPYTTSIQYDGFEFYNVMNNEEFSCEI